MRLRVLGIDPADGTTRVLAEQRDKRWVQLVPGLPARAGDRSLIGHADLGGTRHLTVGGESVTPPDLQLREVLGVDRDEVLFTASTDPAQALTEAARSHLELDLGRVGIRGWSLAVRWTARAGQVVPSGLCAVRASVSSPARRAAGRCTRRGSAPCRAGGLARRDCRTRLGGLPVIPTPR